jgi:hypothetical protein
MTARLEVGVECGASSGATSLTERDDLGVWLPGLTVKPLPHDLVAFRDDGTD